MGNIWKMSPSKKGIFDGIYIYITNHMIPAFPVDDVMGTVGEMAKWDMGYMSPHEELLCFMGKIWENNDQQ